MARQVTSKRSSMKEIILRLRQRLIDWPVITSDCVYLTTRPDDFQHLMANQDVLIHPRRERPEGQFDVGSGRYDRRCIRLVDFWIRTRMMLDIANAHEDWLTNTAGHWELEDNLIDALDLWTPTDANGNELCHQAIRFLDISEPAPEVRQRAAEWGMSIITFEVAYVRALTGAASTLQP